MKREEIGGPDSLGAMQMGPLENTLFMKGWSGSFVHS